MWSPPDFLDKSGPSDPQVLFLGTGSGYVM